MGKFINTLLVGSLILSGCSKEINYNTTKGENVNVKQLKIDDSIYTIDIKKEDGTRVVYKSIAISGDNPGSIRVYNEDNLLIKKYTEFAMKDLDLNSKVIRAIKGRQKPYLEQADIERKDIKDAKKAKKIADKKLRREERRRKHFEKIKAKEDMKNAKVQELLKLL